VVAVSQLTLYGEKTPLHPFPRKIHGSAEFSLDLVHRYRLDRWWDRRLGTLLWVLLNPSTAGAEDTDRTIEQVIHFTWRENFGHLIVVNLFGLVSTQPSALTSGAGPDPVGPLNDKFIAEAIKEAKNVIVAWGDPGFKKGAPTHVRDRAGVILDALGERELWCLGSTKAGFPRHPCRLGKMTPVELWTRPCREPTQAL
jgi:hypothetical protein